MKARLSKAYMEYQAFDALFSAAIAAQDEFSAKYKNGEVSLEVYCSSMAVVGTMSHQNIHYETALLFALFPEMEAK